MANKSIFKAANKTKATPRKGTASMTIESANPKARVVDLTKPKSELIAPPKKSGLSLPGIAGLQKAGPGWKAEPAPAHPEDWSRPKYTGIVKT